MQKFEVGQNIWFISADRPTVKVMLVTEEIVKRTISGNTTEYVFQFNASDKKISVSGTDLVGNYFESRKDAFKFMHEQAGAAINSMLDRAEGKVDKDTLSEKQEDKQSDDIIVELPDGTKARMKGGMLK